MPKLHAAHQSITFHKNVNKYYIIFLHELKNKDFTKKARELNNIDARESSIFFSKCLDEINQIFLPHINSYSSMRWLFYFRRLSNEIFSGDLGTTLPVSRALIEIYASKSKKLDELELNEKIYTFKFDESTLRHIARFVAFINLVYSLQVKYRFANKGVQFLFKSKNDALPKMNIKKETLNAIKFYDSRHDKNGSFLSAILANSGIGINDSTVKNSNESSHSKNINPKAWLLCTEIKLNPRLILPENNYPEFLSAFGKNGYLIAKFSPSEIDLQKVFDIYQHPSMAEHSISQTAATNLISLLLGGEILKKQPLSTVRTMEVGYFIVTPEFWAEHCDLNFDRICSLIKKSLPQFKAPNSFLDFSIQVSKYHSSPWPITHGNPIRVTSSYVCIDMWSASLGFIQSLQFPKIEGKAANNRALIFEDVVQDIVNDSHWAPSHIIKFRQKQLKLNGKIITDIDAIGKYKKNLLIISCKSIPYTQKYDMGEHKAIRNADTMITDAINAWNKITNVLDQNRIGENYDFSEFDKIIGIVCTPFPVYTENQIALDFATDKLLSVSSIEELKEWLKSPQAENI